MEKSNERLEVLKKINKFEKKRQWTKDVENDPKPIVLLPENVDYLNEKLSSKFKTFIANISATNFFEKLLKNKQMIIKEVRGIENYLKVKDGAVITCNHFNACDNYAVWKTIKPYCKKKQKLYKVIREGNFTNFPNPIGFFFRHCNTLPLSSSMETMKKFMTAVDTLLSRGEKILVYPEQSMWWNYKKPRPCQNGAFRMAVTSNVPVIPFFITMTDSNILDKDGFFVQEYTVNILPAIYPKEDLNKHENIEYMKKENYEVWKKTYEDFYKTKLVYLKED